MTEWDFYDLPHFRNPTRRTKEEMDALPKVDLPPRPVEGVTAYGRAALEAELAALAATEEGRRNAQLNIAGFNLAMLVAAGHLDYEPTWQALYETGIGTGLTQSETHNTIRSSFDAGLANPRVVPELPEPPPVTLIDPPSPADDTDEPAPSSWEPLDLGPVLDGTHQPELPTLMARVDGQFLLYPKRVHSFHGESESGKSLVAQAVAAQIVNDGGAVLFLDFESDMVSVVGRLIDLGAGRDAIKQRFTYVKPDTDPRRFVNDRETVARLLAHPYVLAVIDGVTEALGIFGVSTKDNDEITMFMRLLPRAIAQTTGAAVALIDHVTKDTDGRGRFAIGAQAKMSGLDGAAYVVEVAEALGRGKRGLITLRVAKDRPGGVRAHAGPFRKTDRTQEAARIVIDSTGGANIAVTIGEPLTAEQTGTTRRPTFVMQRISEYLEDNPQLVSRKALHDIIGGNKGVFDAALAHLHIGGFVREHGGVRGAKDQESIKPYRQHLDPLSDVYAPPLNPLTSTTSTDLDPTSTKTPPPSTSTTSTGPLRSRARVVQVEDPQSHLDLDHLDPEATP